TAGCSFSASGSDVLTVVTLVRNNRGLSLPFNSSAGSTEIRVDFESLACGQHQCLKAKRHLRSAGDPPRLFDMADLSFNEASLWNHDLVIHRNRNGRLGIDPITVLRMFGADPAREIDWNYRSSRDNSRVSRIGLVGRFDLKRYALDQQGE